MPSTRSKMGHVVGLAYVQVWLLGSDGYGYGSLGETAALAARVASPTTTVLMAPLLLANGKAGAIPSPQRVIKQLTGGNRVRGQITFGPADLGNFPLSLGDTDGRLHAMTSNSALDGTTNQRWYRYSDNINEQALPLCGMLMSAFWQSRELGSDGENLWVNYLIPRCQIQPGTAPLNYQAEADTNYLVVPSLGSREPHGLLYSATQMNLAEDKAMMSAFVTPNPLALFNAIVDGTDTTVQLPYLPSGTTVTINNSPNESAVNGILAALASMSSNGLATLADAGDAEDKVGFLYETNRFDLVA